MSKKVVQNTFNKGLIMDLNPINTPKTVLTDCVNGTILTYDGNEYLLQNDKGNFKLKGCKLDKNYIPIGIKEHADILYIASYNPITKKTQLGSYPSPSYGEKDSEKVFEPSPELTSIFGDVSYVSKTIIDLGTYDVYNYSDLIKKEKTISFIGKDENEFKLNPGDDYKFECHPKGVLDQLETLDYYIMSDNKSLYNINDSIELNEDSKKPIGWDVPGWLVLKQSLLSISDFQICINSDIKYEYNEDDHINAFIISPTFRLKSNDEHLLKLFSEQYHSNLQFCLYIDVSVNGTSIHNGFLKMDKISLEPNGTLVAWKYWTKYVSLDENQTVVFTATPYLLNTNVSDHKKAICFDNNVSTYSFTSNNSYFNNDIIIGNNIWQYNLEDSLEITFDTQNVSPLSAAFLYYTIYTVDKENVYNNDDTKLEHIQVSDWNKSSEGTTTISIDFDNTSEEQRVSGRNYFDKEDIYIIEFDVCSTNTYDAEKISTGPLYKIIISSEIANYINNTERYDQIPWNEWFDIYKSSLDKTLSMDFELTEDPSGLQEVPDENYNIWFAGNNIQFDDFKGYGNPKYNTFVLCDDPNNFSEINYEILGAYNCILKYRANTKILQGNLWNNFNPSITYTNEDESVIKENVFQNGIAPEEISDPTVEQPSYKLHWDLEHLVANKNKIIGYDGTPAWYQEFSLSDVPELLFLNDNNLEAVHVHYIYNNEGSSAYTTDYEFYYHGVIPKTRIPTEEEYAPTNGAINGRMWNSNSEYYDNTWKNEGFRYYNPSLAIHKALSEYNGYYPFVCKIRQSMETLAGRGFEKLKFVDDTTQNANVYNDFDTGYYFNKSLFFAFPIRSVNSVINSKWLLHYDDTNLLENGFLFIPFPDTCVSLNDYGQIINWITNNTYNYSKSGNIQTGGFFRPQKCKNNKNCEITRSVKFNASEDSMIYCDQNLFNKVGCNNFASYIQTKFNDSDSEICVDTFIIDSDFNFNINSNLISKTESIQSDVMDSAKDAILNSVDTRCVAINDQKIKFVNDRPMEFFTDSTKSYIYPYDLYFYYQDPSTTSLTSDQQKFYNLLNTLESSNDANDTKFLLVDAKASDTLHDDNETFLYLGLVNPNVTVPPVPEENE